MTRPLPPRRALTALIAARIVVLAAGLSAGCAGAAPATQPASRAAATQPVLRLANAVPLETLQSAGEQVDFASKFSQPQARTPIYFGTIGQADDGGEVFAIIATKVGEKFKAIRIEDERLTSAQWMYAGAGPALGELWGVLDDATDPPASDLVLVHSVDGGSSWQVTALHKPTDQADFSEFQMDHSGHGRVTLYLSIDVASELAPGDRRRARRHRAAPEPIRAGFYHFRTSDGGKTWALMYEADAMTPAADVPEAEQPVARTLAQYWREGK